MKTGSVLGGALMLFRFMFGAMISRFEQSDFSLVVTDRGQPPNRWRWEIYRAGRPSAVEQSTTLFPTMTAAHRVGKKALLQLFKKLDDSDFE